MVKSLAFVAAGLLLGVGASGFVGVSPHAGSLHAKLATTTSSSGWTKQGHGHWMGGVTGNLVTEAATTLKISTATVQADRKAGDSLATIAVDNGSSASALEAALLTDAQSAIAAAVSAGKITSTQATTIESKLSAMIDQQVTSSPSAMQGGLGGGRMMGNLVTETATTLKISTATVQADLKAGDTLATIAVDNGSSASALEAALLTDAESSIAAAVSAGKITSAQATTVESKLSAMIDQAVTGQWAHGGSMPATSTAS